MRLGRRVRRLETHQGDGWWGAATEQLLALVAVEAGLAVADVRTETERFLVLAQRQGVTTAAELAALVAAERGAAPEVVLAAAADLLARWRGEWR